MIVELFSKALHTNTIRYSFDYLNRKQRHQWYISIHFQSQLLAVDIEASGNVLHGTLVAATIGANAGFHHFLDWKAAVAKACNFVVQLTAGDPVA